jgi:hypothetical protein
MFKAFCQEDQADHWCPLHDPMNYNWMKKPQKHARKRVVLAKHDFIKVGNHDFASCF